MTTVREKDPDTAETYAIDWTDQLILKPLREFDFALAAIVAAQRDTGWYYECTTAGRTAQHYPESWPREAGETVTDGSVVFTCRHPSSASVPSVQSVTWTVPTGLVKDSQLEQGRLAIITVSSGTDGVDYDVLCRMTPSVGNVMEQTIVIPVRAQ
jgi:hypothetical protein